MVAVSNVFQQILHRSPPPPPPLPTSFLKPLRLFSTISSKTPPSKFLVNNNTLFLSHHNQSNPSTKTELQFSPRSLFFSTHTHSLSSHPIKASLALEKNEVDQLEDEDEDEDEDEEEEEYEEEDTETEDLDDDGKEEKLDKEGLHSLRVRTKNDMELPSLSVKEKKELASYAHSLGKKLKSQLIGKSGVNSNVATSFIETLEANELLKIKILRTCPGELEDVVKELEELTSSVVVGKIGRTVILYRPSLTKLKAEEKKRQFQKIFERRKLRPKPTFQSKAAGPRPRNNNRGRRGSSRFSPTPTL